MKRIIEMVPYYEEPVEYRLCRFCLCDIYRFEGNDYFEDGAFPGDSHQCEREVE